MPYYYSTKQTFCILVMLIGISCTCKGRSINYNYTQSNVVGVEAARERMGSYSKDSSQRISSSTPVMEAAVERMRRSNSKESRERMSSSACNEVEAARERMSSNSKELRERMGAKTREFRERKGTVDEGVNWRGLRERKSVNGRGLRERKSVDSRELRERMGADSREVIDQQYMEWVKFMGSLRNHSLFGVAKNVFEIKSTLVVVDKSPGKGHFTTIQQAVNSVPAFNLFRVVIQINPGIYTEKVSIPWSKPYITFQGAGSNKTIIQWNDTAGSLGSDGKPLGTFNSATVAIDAPYFIARNLTFKNTAPWQLGEKNKQASAARVSGDASAFVGCQFLGAQDTLYDHKGRHYFQDCYIEGSVDFIFGDGLSMYQNCHMHAIGARYESITAQSRSNLLQDSGFSFVKCKVTGSGPLYLGRAWGTFSRVVYAYTYMDNIIVPEGWYNWGDPKREGTVYYGQYKCMGPGATTGGRVMWSRELTDEEAQPFLDLTFVDGDEWIGL